MAFWSLLTRRPSRARAGAEGAAHVEPVQRVELPLSRRQPMLPGKVAAWATARCVLCCDTRRAERCWRRPRPGRREGLNSGSARSCGSGASSSRHAVGASKGHQC
eukprot:1463881-Heterocapsa_arctica.AAC.1